MCSSQSDFIQGHTLLGVFIVNKIEDKYKCKLILRRTAFEIPLHNFRN